MPDGRVLLAVADVCGKGLQAALIASSLHSLVRALVETVDSVSALVERTNAHLAPYLPEHSFVTALFVAVDVHEGRLEYVNTGHLPPIVVNSLGQARLLQAGTNPALGMLSELPSSEVEAVDDDEVLCLYTDGVSDAGDPADHALGVNRLASALSAIVSSAPSARLESFSTRLLANVKARQGVLGATDDSTFLLAKLLGTKVAVRPTIPVGR
jgi:serine phosphatase RsbU (regulator of sigma subunit)